MAKIRAAGGHIVGTDPRRATSRGLYASVRAQNEREPHSRSMRSLVRSSWRRERAVDL